MRDGKKKRQEKIIQMVGDERERTAPGAVSKTHKQGAGGNLRENLSQHCMSMFNNGSETEGSGMRIKDLIKECHQNAVEHGFWDDWDKLDDFIENARTQKEIDILSRYADNAIGNRLMLIVSELGEALEVLRQGGDSEEDDEENARIVMEKFSEELADVAIRLFDLCGGLDIDLEAAMAEKMEKNRNRPRLHGKKF